ncbi:MAG: META domain-containing protein [Patescibacteria group bacterium]
MKHTSITIAAIVVAVACVAAFFVLTYRDEPIMPIGSTDSTMPKPAATPQTTAYQIEGRWVSIGDTLRYFGNELALDLDGDGREDSVFFVTQQTGGSGTFYYVVAAVQTDGGYVGSNGIFVGDRIAPQTINLGIHADPASADAARPIIAVNYADRKPGESFAARPSVGQTLWLRFDPASGELVKAAPAPETTRANSVILTSKKWTWMSTTYNDGTKIVPKKAGVFVVTFGKNGAFSASTDCNSMGGQYDATEHLITFKNIISTLMYCEASQEGDFQKTLGQAASYFFSPSGELVLDLKYDSGSAVFR